MQQYIKGRQSTIEELAELDKKYYFHPTSSLKKQQAEGPDFIFEEGNGVYLTDMYGKKVFDGLSSLWNVNIGHGREELAEAAKQQMTKLGFSSSFASFSHEPAIRLAAKIASMTPGDLNSIFFTSGGSESNDTAFKLVRHYWMLKGHPEKRIIVSRKRSYHGVAMGSTSATGLDAFHYFTNSNNPDFEHVKNDSVEDFQTLIDREGAENIAAYISEPVQGTGGVLPPHEDYFKKVKDICEKNNILFIADEVITGFGRTGTNFGIEQYGVEPDVITFAKGVTSGYMPLGGVALKESMKKVFNEKSEGILFHGYTYSGHPAACAVALENIDIIEREGLKENAKQMGIELEKAFQKLQRKHDTIGEVRTTGLLGAVELIRKEEEPMSPKVVKEALKRGLVCRGTIYEGSDILVFAPPLIVTKEQIYEMTALLEDAISAVEENL